MFPVFDTHAHYTDARFEEEYPGGAGALRGELFSGCVGKIINVSVDTKNSLEVIAQAKKYEGMYAAVGVHPTEAHKETSLSEALSSLRRMLDGMAENRIVAIGEIGLDYHWEPVDRALQKEFFEAQLDLAEEYSLPVLIHDRDAHGDCFETVIRRPQLSGVFHSFSGSPEMARELVRRGWYISFSGVVTFKNAKNVRAVAASVPRERILLETDAPYLAPEPHRGKLNRSDYIVYSSEALAGVLGADADTVRRIAYENAERLFNFT